MPLSSDRHIIDEQFSKKLRQHKSHPSGKVWNHLTDDLHLAARRNQNGRRFLLVALLLLLGSGGVLINSNIHPGKIVSSKLIPQHSANDFFITSGTSKVIPFEKAVESNSEKASERNTSSNDQEMPLVTATAKDEIDFYAEVESDWKESVTRLIGGPSLVPFEWYAGNGYVAPLAINDAFDIDGQLAFARTNELRQHAYPSISNDPDFYIADAAGLYFGFGQTFNSTFIVDGKSFHDDNLRFTPTFGMAIMVQSGYNFNNKWGVEGAWVIHSQEGQRYKYLPEDNRTTSLEYNQKHVSFNYMQFPVLMRYKVQGWSGITETPFFVNYSLGVQYGRMITYSVDESKERVSNQNLFRKNEYAVVAALDYDFISRKAAFFTIGLRTSIGSNLFVKDTPEYLEFDDPHNFLLGVHAAVN
ncbi:MAG: outer membrane beta-barrel protein, partial [Chitinophagales bacterium]